MLYVVATPIGNLGDITVRALDILKSADVIAAEDTRYSGILLKHFAIKKPLVSFHEHNEAMRTAQLIERIAAGENIALITDAGMPGLSDPGGRLIRECIRLAIHHRPRRLFDLDRCRRVGVFSRQVFLRRVFAA
jgi:16S rRNA (cytidine1402-2'-O)-methyltransferase